MDILTQGESLNFDLVPEKEKSRHRDLKGYFFTKSGYVTFYPGYTNVMMLKYI
jgi:hypothetical protein